ncbi:50S ribosomal protein L13 [Candidatus Peregrinibacteria bacterium RIFCSPLOWO2_01_FULL_39_12]|nr:MAG: 50S ribosomal protein L13 [Candidatus Peregrinibacteria bacterium RIFCSPLOWO2_01_FULL_39_12]
MNTKKSETKKPEIKWYIVDAKDKTLGRMAAKIAARLRGKNNPNFTPHMACGDGVIVINAEKIHLTGKKWTDKIYYTHSGYPGAIKGLPAKELFSRKSTQLVKLAVFGMLPKNKLRKAFMNNLKLYEGDKHPHEAQNPISLDI